MSRNGKSRRRRRLNTENEETEKKKRNAPPHFAPSRSTRWLLFPFSFSALCSFQSLKLRAGQRKREKEGSSFPGRRSEAMGEKQTALSLDLFLSSFRRGTLAQPSSPFFNLNVFNPSPQILSTSNSPKPRQLSHFKATTTPTSSRPPYSSTRPSALGSCHRPTE